MGNAHWIRLPLLVTLGVVLAGVGYLIQQKRTPRERRRADPWDAITVLMLLGGAIDALSPNATVFSQACLVIVVGWAGMSLATAWHGH